MDLDHVGIATTQADQLAALFGELLDAELVHEEQPADIHFLFLDVGGQYLELLEPLDETSDIGQYIAEAGEGIHHLGFETDDLRSAMDRARNAGVELLDDEPRPGAWGHEIAFLDPGSTGGALIEFFGYPAESA